MTTMQIALQLVDLAFHDWLICWTELGAMREVLKDALATAWFHVWIIFLGVHDCGAGLLLDDERGASATTKRE